MTTPSRMSLEAAVNAMVNSCPRLRLPSSFRIASTAQEVMQANDWGEHAGSKMVKPAAFSETEPRKAVCKLKHCPETLLTASYKSSMSASWPLECYLQSRQQSDGLRRLDSGHATRFFLMLRTPHVRSTWPTQSPSILKGG
jgi:hypothetical protein